MVIYCPCIPTHLWRTYIVIKVTQYYSFPHIFNRKIAHILDGGTEKLQCVFDFDATISKAWHNGEKVNKKIIFGTKKT